MNNEVTSRCFSTTAVAKNLSDLLRTSWSLQIPSQCAGRSNLRFPSQYLKVSAIQSRDVLVHISTSERSITP